MSQEQDDGAGAEAAIEVDDPIGLEAPERGSADELMDHGAAGELGPMRHSAAHVLAEAVLDLFPGTKLGIGPVIDDGFYYDFQLPRPLTPDDLPAIEARMRESIAADHPFELSELSPAEAPRVPRRARPAVQGRDRRRPRWPPPSATAPPMPPTTFYQQGPFIDLCRGPHVGEHRARSGRSSCSARPARTGAATRSARCSSASTARPGRPRRSSTSTCGGARRRRSATTAGSASQLDLFSFHDVSPGLGVLASQGPDASGARSRARCASSRSGAATRRSARRSSCPSGCGGSPATGTSTRRTCSSSSPRTSCSASSR